jgi:hypothetical protein
MFQNKSYDLNSGLKLDIEHKSWTLTGHMAKMLECSGIQDLNSGSKQARRPKLLKLTRHGLSVWIAISQRT